MKKQKATHRVTLDCRRPYTHRILVTIESLDGYLPEELVFPVWTPGSYMVREYSRHVTSLAPGEKTAKNRWKLRPGTKKVRYEVYAQEKTVRTSFIDDNYAALVGASLLPLLGSPFEVHLLLPKSWSFVSSALNFRKKGAGEFTAAVHDDDHWIDCPIVAASPGFGEATSFRVKGITHHVAWVGTDCARSMKEFERDFAKIASTVIDMFGGAPFKEYWFLLHFGHKLYGGLEHRDSQLSQYDGTSLIEDNDYDGFLRLIAHEYFHSWNVKAIRPKALGPFDYSQENYTEDLWFAEGLTDYFDDMIPWKAGLIKEDAYWKARLKDAQLMADGHPGHERRSVGESSFDAWIRYYRADEDSVNTDVSYYSKGALLGWCWDAHLQKHSKRRWSLWKLMKAIYEEFGINAYEPLDAARPGFSRAALLAFAEKKTGVKQAKLVESWVTARKPLPWREAAAFFGIQFETKAADTFFHQSGAQLQWKGSSCLVAKVLSASSAESAGLSANDEILAVNGSRPFDQEHLKRILKKLGNRPASLEVIFSRLDKVMVKKLKYRPHPQVGVEYKLTKARSRQRRYFLGK